MKKTPKKPTLQELAEQQLKMAEEHLKRAKEQREVVNKLIAEYEKKFEKERLEREKNSYDWRTIEGVRQMGIDALENMKKNEILYKIPKRCKLKMRPTIKEQLFTTFVN